MLWFFMSPLTPLFSLLSPWVRAEEKLRQEGLTGFPLVIGGGSESERRYDSSGEYWRREEQSTYLVLPDSFRRFEVYTYSEVEGSGIAGAQVTLVRSSLLAPLVIWLLAGSFTVWQIRQWLAKKKPNPAPEPMAGLTPGHGSS